MSVVQNPIVGRSSGKFSNAIFSKWKNKNVLRSKPLIVNQPNTPAQIEQRSLFTAAVRYSRFLLTYARLSMKSAAQSMTEFNLLMKKIITSIDPSTYVLNESLLSELSLAFGPKPGFQNAAVAKGIVGISATWDNSYLEHLRSPTDVVQFIAYNADRDKFFITDIDTLFSVGSIDFPVPADSGDIIHVWFVTSNAERTEFSNSLYVDSVSF